MQFSGQEAYSQFRKEYLLLYWRLEWETIPTVAKYKFLVRSCESALLYMMAFIFLSSTWYFDFYSLSTSTNYFIIFCLFFNLLLFYTEMAPRKGKEKKEEQVISLGPQVAEGENVFGVCHIFASFNDTFVHVTDLSGK